MRAVKRTEVLPASAPPSKSRRGIQSSEAAACVQPGSSAICHTWPPFRAFQSPSWCLLPATGSRKCNTSSKIPSAGTHPFCSRPSGRVPGVSGPAVVEDARAHAGEQPGKAGARSPHPRHPLWASALLPKAMEGPCVRRARGVEEGGGQCVGLHSWGGDPALQQAQRAGIAVPTHPPPGPRPSTKGLTAFAQRVRFKGACGKWSSQRTARGRSGGSTGDTG